MPISVPLGARAPIAPPSREANSGVNSTLINPLSPYELNRPRFHEPAQMIDSWTTAPGSTINPNVRIWPNKEVEPGAVVHESIIWAGSWKRGLFSSYGLNGLINVEFTPEFASRLGAAIGALAPKGTEIAISRDYTRSARMIHRAVISGLISSGTSVIDLSVLPAPVSRYWARHNHVAAVHVQTSPVDPRSADIRLFDDHGLNPDKRSERRLEGLFFREDIRR